MVDSQYIPAAEFGAIFFRAANKALAFRTHPDGWSFDCESDYKLELFHCLANETFNAVPLAAKLDGMSTCLLHSEGKVENGNPAKADLLICNPTKRQRFNYKVDYVIELKTTFSRAALQTELQKSTSYKNPYKFYLSSYRTPRVTDIDIDSYPDRQGEFTIFQPSNTDAAYNHFSRLEDISFDTAIDRVKDAINETLYLYGNGGQQYQGFFWCNYEHETNKRQTYPCEGDFNAQLYHRLRNSLPPSVEIKSEVNPGTARQRIDLVIRHRNDGWAIPVDIKMNWDQFKAKFDQKTKTEKTPEATLILDRMASFNVMYAQIFPVFDVSTFGTN